MNNQNWVAKNVFYDYVKTTNDLIAKYQELIDRYEKEIKNKDETIELQQKLQVVSDKMIEDYRILTDDLQKLTKELIAKADVLSNWTPPPMPKLAIFGLFKK